MLFYLNDNKFYCDKHVHCIKKKKAFKLIFCRCIVFNNCYTAATWWTKPIFTFKWFKFPGLVVRRAAANTPVEQFR